MAGNKWCAVVLCVGAAGASQADEGDLQIYGLVDAAVATTRSSGLGSRSGLLSGGQSDSLWGLNISEPWGDGWTTRVNLESGFDLPSGQSNTAGQLFDYGSWVGLANPRYGELRLGRQSTIGKDYGNALEVASWREMGMGALFKASDNYRRDNLINVYTPAWQGWQAGLGYAFDAGSADADARGHAWSAGLKYESAPWLAVLTWDRLHPGAGSQAAGRSPTAWQAGLGYQGEGWKVSAAWSRQSNGFVGQDGGGIEGLGPLAFIQGGQVQTWMLGTEIATGASSAVLLQASLASPDWHWESGQRAKRVQLYTLGWRENLSARTSIYAFVGRLLHGTLDDTLTPDGGNTTRVAVGMTQRF